jgi:hypothetical protein
MKKIPNQLPHSSQQVRVGSLLDEDSLVKKQGFKKKVNTPSESNRSQIQSLSSAKQNIFSNSDKYTVNEFYRLLETTSEKTREKALKDLQPTKPKISINIVDHPLSEREKYSESFPEITVPSIEYHSSSFLIAKGTITYEHNRKRKQRHERNGDIAAPSHFLSSALEDPSSSEGLELFYSPDISFEIFQILNICYSIECHVISNEEPSSAGGEVVMEKKVVFISQNSVSLYFFIYSGDFLPFPFVSFFISCFFCCLFP